MGLYLRPHREHTSVGLNTQQAVVLLLHVIILRPSCGGDAVVGVDGGEEVRQDRLS